MMHRNLKSRLYSGLLATAMGVAVHTQAGAAQTINLTVVSGYAPVAAWVKVFKEYYVPEVAKRLAKTDAYRIKWNEGFSGTIAKPAGELDAVQKGLADIGMIQTVFHPDKLPLYGVAYATPFVTTDIGLVVRTVNDLTDKFPAMKDGWGKYNQVFLTTLGTVDNYQVATSKPIKSLSDFKGLKIGGAGPNLRYLEGLGATGVASNLVEMYNNLKTGVADGWVIWAEAAVNFKVYEVAPYYVVADLGAANSIALSANKDIWAKLPPEVKAVLAEVAIGYGAELAKYVDKVSAASVEKFVANGGKLVKLTPEQRKAWAAALPNIGKEWADGLEKDGLPARAVLGAYMDTMRKNNQPILRNWDKE